MLSMRSSCDVALRRSDWRRFWPLLFLYAAVWLMLLPLGLWNRRWSVYNADTLEQVLSRIESTVYDMYIPAVVIAAIFAVLLAMTLYGYLMNGRSVGLMHTLPINRTKQFFNHFLVGVEIFTLVHVVTVIVALLVQSGYGVVAWEATLTWFAVAELSCLFFFAFATLCAMVTGWVIAIPVIYVGVNAMFAAFYGLLQVMFDLFYWGYNSADFPALVSWLTPFVQLINVAGDTYHYDSELKQATYHLTAAGWTTLLVYTVVAVVFIVVGWLFYKARRSESAGDAIVFDWLRPIVLYVISVVGGMGFGFLLYYLVFDGAETLPGVLICQIIAGIVVYFAVQMLLNKSFKVFNRRGWLGAALLAVMLIVIGVAVKFDLLGYERYIPAEDKVEFVNFSGSMMRCDISAEDDVIRSRITDIHRAVLAQGEDTPDASMEYGNNYHFSFTYHLTNGTYVRRNYNLTVEQGSALHDAMNEFINAKGVYTEGFFSRYDPTLASSVVGGYYHNYSNDWYEKYEIVDAETGVTVAETAPVKEQQLTADQAQALYRAVGQHIQRKDREFIDALTYYNSYESRQSLFDLEFHFGETEFENSAIKEGQDAPYYDTWHIYDLPGDCTEVLDLLIEFGLAKSYDDLLSEPYIPLTYATK